MKMVRIRSKNNEKDSPWIYIQENTRKNPAKETPKAKTVMTMAASSTKNRYNQYGLFQFGESQYGEIIRDIKGNIQILKTPIRIRMNDGAWIISQHAEINGMHPAVRIRTKRNQESGTWVYLQNKEV